MPMIGRRIGFYVVTAVVAITVNFFIPRLMPGNPALAVIGRIQSSESKQAIAALEEQYGVQTRTGLWGQYLQYWAHLLHGNLGTSLNYYPASVGSLIRAALPWTIGLIGTATVISFVLGTLLGVAAAWRRGSWLDGAAARHDLLPGRAVLLRRHLVRGAVRDQAGLAPAELGLRHHHPGPRRWTGRSSPACSSTPSCPR